MGEICRKHRTSGPTLPINVIIPVVRIKVTVRMRRGTDDGRSLRVRNRSTFPWCVAGLVPLSATAALQTVPSRRDSDENVEGSRCVRAIGAWNHSINGDAADTGRWECPGASAGRAFFVYRFGGDCSSDDNSKVHSRGCTAASSPRDLGRCEFLYAAATFCSASAFIGWPILTELSGIQSAGHVPAAGLWRHALPWIADLSRGLLWSSETSSRNVAGSHDG